MCVTSEELQNYYTQELLVSAGIKTRGEGKKYRYSPIGAVGDLLINVLV